MYKWFLLLAFTCMPCMAQVTAPDSPLGYSEIAELKADIVVQVDDDGLPSHTVEWDLDDRELSTRVKYYENGSILVVPTGCKDADIFVDVRVTDWVKRQITKTTVKIRVRGDDEDDGTDPIKDPIEEEDPAVKKSPLYKVTQMALAEVIDPDKNFWANHMSKQFGMIAGQIKDKQFTSVEEMLEAVRRANRGEGTGSPWPDESRRKWTTFRMSIAQTLDQIESAGELNSLDDYWVHWKAVELALKGGGQ